VEVVDVLHGREGVQGGGEVAVEVVGAQALHVGVEGLQEEALELEDLLFIIEIVTLRADDHDGRQKGQLAIFQVQGVEGAAELELFLEQ